MSKFVNKSQTTKEDNVPLGELVKEDIRWAEECHLGCSGPSLDELAIGGSARDIAHRLEHRLHVS